MWTWLRDNTEALQGLGALITALAALTALIIIPLQINAAENIQQRQAARDMYRGFVQITLERPSLANADYCALTTPDEVTAYSAYMEYMLYTGEQLMITSPADWTPTLKNMFASHANYFCAQDGWDGYGTSVAALIEEVRAACSLSADCAQSDGA